MQENGVGDDVVRGRGRGHGGLKGLKMRRDQTVEKELFPRREREREAAEQLTRDLRTSQIQLRSAFQPSDSWRRTRNACSFKREVGNPTRTRQEQTGEEISPARLNASLRAEVQSSPSQGLKDDVPEQKQSKAWKYPEKQG